MKRNHIVGRYLYFGFLISCFNHKQVGIDHILNVKATCGLHLADQKGSSRSKFDLLGMSPSYPSLQSSMIPISQTNNVGIKVARSNIPGEHLHLPDMPTFYSLNPRLNSKLALMRSFQSVTSLVFIVLC